MFIAGRFSIYGRLALFAGAVCFVLMVVVGQMEANDAHSEREMNSSHNIYLPLVLSAFNEPTSAPTVDENTFLETFDGAPSSPAAWTDDNWEVTVHLRDQDTLYSMPAMEAHHGPNCEAPPATHTITAHEDTVYQCRNHVMTSLYGVSQTGGYGLIYLTPNQLLDTTGNFSIHFDMSTFRANNLRDWIDVWLTPYGENLQLAIHDFEPDLQGPPQTAVQFKLDVANRLEMYLHEDGRMTKISPDVYTEYDLVLNPSKTTRSTFVIAVYNDVLYVGLPDHDLWWYEQDVPDLFRGEDWEEAVVQFGHHSYTPDKQCASSDNPSECGPNTYHWDNVALWPAKPFTMIHASPQLITNSTPASKLLTLESPAPADAKLRFAAIGDAIDVSFNGGLTWQAATLQDAPSRQDRHFFRSYWMNIPEGTEEVLFRGEDWMFFSVWGGEWAVRDASVWSLADENGRQTAVAGLNAKRVAAFLTLKENSDVMTCLIPSDE